MPLWHLDLHKRKPTGGRRRPYRGKRRYERGGYPVETILGEEKRKVERVRGGNFKVKLFSGRYVNLSDPRTGRTEKTEVVRVLGNEANVDYDRRGVITRGALVETPRGVARVTSRPGQDGVLNAVLVKPRG